MRSWNITRLEDLEEVAKEILEYASPQKKFAIHGDLGAGKTTLIKSFCKYLGVIDPTSSPTFAIVNEYEGGEKIFHFDLYRIKNKKELDDIGFEEYLKSGNYVFVEWPEIAEAIMWHYNTAKISIEVDENLQRIITLER